MSVAPSSDQIDPILWPLGFALLAANMADFVLDDAAAAAAPPTDFVLEFELATRVGLSVEHNSQWPEYTVKASASIIADLDRVGHVALRLNHHLPAAMKFSLEESTPPTLHVTQTLAATGLELDALAFAITQASEVLQLALTPEIFEDAQIGPASVSPESLITMIRG